jgi:cytochrome c6
MRRRLALALLVLGLGAVGVAGCGGGEEVAPLPETVEGTVGGETEPATTEETTTEETTTQETTTGEGTTGAATEEGGGQVQGNAEAGATIFSEQGCGGCHVLEAAGSSGTVGPNLDESQPEYDLIIDRVTNGQGVMPAFGDELSEQQIQDVAAYVVQSTQGS